MKISKDTFEKTTLWMRRNARPLEAARWSYIFENDSRERVISCLAAFQNKDGGFGHGLEPDFWLPKSSPMASWAGGQILLEVEAGPEEEIVQKLLFYLHNTLDKKTGMWESVLSENNDYPHAPHWHWKQGVQDNWMFNPGAELAAMLVHWSPEGSTESEAGWFAVKKAAEYALQKNEMDMHEINNFQRMAEILAPQTTVFKERCSVALEALSDKIMLFAEKAVEKDVSLWNTDYLALPLDFVNTPDDLICKRFGSLVEENLIFYKRQMTNEGIWDITWEWDSFQEEFAVARRQWQGIIAVNRYKKLKAFGWLA